MIDSIDEKLASQIEARLNIKLPSKTNDMDADTLATYTFILRNIVSTVYYMFHDNHAKDVDNKLINASVFDIELYVIALMDRWPKETYFCAGFCITDMISKHRTVHPVEDLPQYLMNAIHNIATLLELKPSKE